MRTALVFLFLALTTAGQDELKYACGKKDRPLVNEYFDKREENEALAKKIKEGRRGKLPLCWHGCAVSLPKPYVPETARRLSLSGTVSVSVVADENGRVFYAKPTSGPGLLRGHAQQAACAARFTPIQYDEKLIKFPWSIRYNFTR